MDERLIVALDVDDGEAARRLVEGLGETVAFYKVGLQLFLGGGGFAITDWLRERGKRVFLDLKLYDVPRTVEATVQRVLGRGISFLTVHGDAAILKAATGARAAGGEGEPLRILAVTVLTSLGPEDLREMGIERDVTDLVVARARRAAAAGCDGVIASGQEARALRNALGERLLLVVPGIRERAEEGRDDQKRTVDVEEALSLGADHLVVGRPIHGAPDPAAAARRFQDRIVAWSEGHAG